MVDDHNRSNKLESHKAPKYNEENIMRKQQETE